MAEQWGPDVREVMEQNIRACRHFQRGTCCQVVSAGGGLIGSRTVSYYGCLLCKQDLAGLEACYEMFAKDSGVDRETWMDQELARTREADPAAGLLG